MLGKDKQRDPARKPDDGFELLQELEQNTSEEVRRQRAHFRIAVKSAVILRPGNASERLEFRLQGITGDLSEGGCRALFPMPVGVGDVYQLEFDPKVLPLPITFSRCLRCRLLREDAFEAGFQFFRAITLPEHVFSRIESSDQREWGAAGS